MSTPLIRETHVLESVGNTPLVRLRRLVPDGCARILVKVEGQNPTGRTTRKLIRSMIAKATELSSAPDAFFADQFNNPDAAAGYRPLAEEIWNQTGGKAGAFVQSVGTAQCVRGVAELLRQRNPGIRIVAVEPAESPVLAAERRVPIRSKALVRSEVLQSGGIRIACRAQLRAGVARDGRL